MANLKPILLVEDNPNDIELTQAALQAPQLANGIAICRDGAEALDFIYRGGPHEGRQPHDLAVILPDMKLPEVDGLQVLAKVQGDFQTRGIPNVMLTSSSEETDVVRCSELDMKAAVVRPFEFDESFAAIEDFEVFWGVLNVPPPHRGGWSSNV